MKAHLMHRDRDLDLERELPPGHEALTQDLELARLLAAMARGDEFLFDVARKVVLSSLAEPDEIRYRQDVLRDCLAHPDVVRRLYDIAVDAISRERRVYSMLFSRSPDAVLYRSLQVMELFVGSLRRLRALCDEHGPKLRSAGFTTLVRMLQAELSDGYLESVEEHLRTLGFRSGVLSSARFGKGLRGEGYVLRTPRPQGWLERLSMGGISPTDSLSFRIAERDESGHRALTELKGRGLSLVANALARSADHVLAFFRMLRAELAFYVGCLNLEETLTGKGEPACFPEALPRHRPILEARGLYDACLSLSVRERVVGNDVRADGVALVMITGANRGGKSTFLRSVGVAHLMMQCGMRVGATSFRASVCAGVFTHFRREEDVTMRSGKLDEELRRMSEIADVIGPGSLLLCNESFAATNEREGSEIARQIVRALLETGVRVVFVTHMYDLARGFHAAHTAGALFLRAERRPDGQRTFRLIEAEPLPTSYGKDLYRRIFGPARAPSAYR